MGAITGKKTAEAAVEQDAEVKRFLQRAGTERGVDLESWEFGLRQAVLLAGARLLEQLLVEVGVGRRDEPVMCACGCRMKSRGLVAKTILTILGAIIFRRSRFVCPACGSSRFPGDEALEVRGTMFSPGVCRLMARAGQRDTFKEGMADLREFAAVEVTAKDVERVSEGMGAAVEDWQAEERLLVLAGEAVGEALAEVPILYVSYDGTGVPMTREEVAGRRGKQADGSSKTREAKLGCVFTQVTTDAEGWPVREDGSTSFVGAIESSEEFGWRIYAEAKRRGLECAEKVVVLADGARYNWEIAALHFSGAVEIVDLYHARQHLHDLVDYLLPQGGRETERRQLKWRTMLDEGRVEKIIAEAEQSLPRNGPRREAAVKQINYFRNNMCRMRYREFRDQGLFVGSGVVEAGCKTVIGKRLKQSGMEWSVRGANAIIALRCLYLSGRTEEFYEQRAA